MEQINAPILKNCPFCGGKACLFVDSGVRVYCTSCGCETPTYRDAKSPNGKPYGNAVKSVVEKWNRRTEMEL